MSSNDFVEDFISECIDNGISSQKAIAEKAYIEIQEIDKKLRESNLLRIRYRNLKDVLKEFNHESLKRIKENQVAVYNSIDDIKDSSYYNILIEICEFIDSSKNIVTSREIMDAISNIENNKVIFGCIKTLSDNGIISRNKDRHILKGPKWDERPLISSDNST